MSPIATLKREAKKLSGSSLAQNAAWMFAGQGMGFFLRAAYFVLLARLLGRNEYGMFVGAMALATIASQYSGLGSGTLFVRYVSSDKEKFAAYWGNILLSTFCTGMVIAFGLYLASNHLMAKGGAALLLVVAVSECMCGKLTTSAGQVFQTFEKLRMTAMLGLLISFLRMVAAVVLLMTLHHVSARQWAIAFLSMSILSTAIAIIAITVQFGRPKFNPRLFFKTAGEGFGFSFAGSTSVFYNDIDKAMLSHAGMNAANGIYGLAYRVIDMATMPIISIDMAALPRFFRKGVNGIDAAADFAKKIIKRTSLLGAASAAILALAAPILPRLAGKDFGESVHALYWLCLIPFFRSFQLSAGSALTGAGFQRYRTVMQVSAAALNFGLNLWLIPTYTWRGAAWASLATDGAMGLLNWLTLYWLKSRKKTPALQVEGA